MPDFDMLVLGSGPGGRKAAVAAAAEPGRRVAVVDRPDMLGGVSLPTGTIPSTSPAARRPDWAGAASSACRVRSSRLDG